jgi:hypothetical protein
MQIVHATSAIACVLVYSLLAPGGPVAPRAQADTIGEARILDLRHKRVTKSQVVVPVPGSAVGSKSKKNDRYLLPLRATIESAAAVGGKLEVRFRLTNVGARPYSLPVSQDAALIRAPGNVDRHTFLVSASIEDGSGASPWQEGVATTDGSGSVPGSYWSIAPGASVIVLLDVDLNLLPSTVVGHGLSLKVTCNEWKLGDSHYFIEALSDNIPSDSVVVNF